MSQELRIEFDRIHVGDIIIDDDDIFGDGVNIAARLEGIAEPSGVCLSDDAHRQIRGKVDLLFDDIGEQNLKNIAEPMRAWRMRQSGDGVPESQLDSSPLRRPHATSAPPGQTVDRCATVRQHVRRTRPGLPCRRIVEAITTTLSCIRSFFVIARSSAFTYKGRGKPCSRNRKGAGVAPAGGQCTEGRQSFVSPSTY